MPHGTIGGTIGTMYEARAARVAGFSRVSKNLAILRA